MARLCRDSHNGPSEVCQFGPVWSAVIVLAVRYVLLWLVFAIWPEVWFDAIGQ